METTLLAWILCAAWTPIQDTEEEIDKLIQGATKIEFADFVTAPAKYEGKVVRFRVLWEKYVTDGKLHGARVQGGLDNPLYDLLIHPVGGLSNGAFLSELKYKFVDLVVRGNAPPKTPTDPPATAATLLAVQLRDAKTYRRLYPTKKEIEAVQNRDAKFREQLRQELNRKLENGDFEGAWSTVESDMARHYFSKEEHARLVDMVDQARRVRWAIQDQLFDAASKNLESPGGRALPEKVRTFLEEEISEARKTKEVKDAAEREAKEKKEAANREAREKVRREVVRRFEAEDWRALRDYLGTEVSYGEREQWWEVVGEAEAIRKLLDQVQWEDAKKRLQSPEAAPIPESLRKRYGETAEAIRVDRETYPKNPVRSVKIDDATTVVFDFSSLPREIYVASITFGKWEDPKELEKRHRQIPGEKGSKIFTVQVKYTYPGSGPVIPFQSDAIWLSTGWDFQRNYYGKGDLDSFVWTCVLTQVKGGVVRVVRKK